MKILIKLILNYVFRKILYYPLSCDRYFLESPLNDGYEIAYVPTESTNSSTNSSTKIPSSINTEDIPDQESFLVESLPPVSTNPKFTYNEYWGNETDNYTDHKKLSEILKDKQETNFSGSDTVEKPDPIEYSDMTIDNIVNILCRLLSWSDIGQFKIAYKSNNSPIGNFGTYVIVNIK